MTSTLITDTITAELQALSQDEKRKVLPRFFKTGKGEYGEGDAFLGVVVPDVRGVARKHKAANLDEIHELMASAWHEVRLCALLIMVYLSLTEHINNWDLVDLSCRFVVGEYLLDKPRDILYRLAESPLLWDNRIAIVSTFAFIRHNQLDDTFALADKMMVHTHDLMHKAIGWMLREAGKHDEQRLYNYIMQHRKEMPRTILRYAIEKFPPDVRSQLMSRS